MKIIDIKDLKTCAEGEYPEAEITQKNLEDAYILQSDYAAPKSETTAIMTYSYQSYLVKPHSPAIADVLEKIAISEMRHHEILAKMILASGGNPVIGARGSYWYGGYVDYSQTIKKMLENDIAAEKSAIESYKQTIATLNNKSIVPVIERIIADEQVHIATLEALLNFVNFWQG